MDRISGANFITILLKRFWQDRNAQNGVFAGTFGNALWFNGVQESILSPVEKVGFVPTDADNTQLYQAIVAIQSRGLYVFNQPGAFTWTAPEAWTQAHCIVIGGGAGGASGIDGYAGYGGSSGGFAWDIFQVIGGAAIPGFVGVGGASDQPGGTSALGFVTSTGGKPGAQGSAGGATASGYGAVGIGTGTLALNGTFGDAPISSGSLQIGGDGGSGFFSGGGKGGLAASGAGCGGSAGVAPGAGGGGGSGPEPGGVGAPGLVFIWR